MINARIAGTAIHLNYSPETQADKSQISYKKYRIWGIKTVIKYLIEDIFKILYENLPTKEDFLEPEKDLLKPMKILCERYLVPHSKVVKFIEERKTPKQIWETLDSEQQIIFEINSFFEAFEENLIDSYYLAITLSKFLFKHFKTKAKLNRQDFGLADFGFVFRARGYSFSFSKYVYNNGFNNTVKRLNELLLKEYNDTFLNKKEQKQIEPKEIALKLEQLPEEKKYVIEMLRHGNSSEKLEAINLILENKITEALNDLEYLLKNKDETVMNAAFNAIVMLKGLE